MFSNKSLSTCNTHINLIITKFKYNHKQRRYLPLLTTTHHFAITHHYSPFAITHHYSSSFTTNLSLLTITYLNETQYKSHHILIITAPQTYHRPQQDSIQTSPLVTTTTILITNHSTKEIETALLITKAHTHHKQHHDTMTHT